MESKKVFSWLNSNISNREVQYNDASMIFQGDLALLAIPPQTIQGKHRLWSHFTWKVLLAFDMHHVIMTWHFFDLEMCQLVSGVSLLITKFLLFIGNPLWKRLNRETYWLAGYQATDWRGISAWGQWQSIWMDWSRKWDLRYDIHE